jgi:hypothetical protein
MTQHKPRSAVLDTVKIRNQTFSKLANPLDRAIVNDTTQKRCPKCGWTRYLRNFPRKWASPDGRGSWCVDCKREEYENRKRNRATCDKLPVHP